MPVLLELFHYVGCDFAKTVCSRLWFVERAVSGAKKLEELPAQQILKINFESTIYVFYLLDELVPEKSMHRPYWVTLQTDILKQLLEKFFSDLNDVSLAERRIAFYKTCGHSESKSARFWLVNNLNYVLQKDSLNENNEMVHKLLNGFRPESPTKIAEGNDSLKLLRKCLRDLIASDKDILTLPTYEFEQLILSSIQSTRPSPTTAVIAKNIAHSKP